MKRLLAAVAAGLVLGGGTATATTIYVMAISQSKVRYVYSPPFTTVNPGAPYNIILTCPTGWTDLFAGYSTVDGMHPDAVSEPNPGTVEFRGINKTFSAQAFHAQVKCVPVVP